MHKYIIFLLEETIHRLQKIKMLQYELEHPVILTPDEIIDSLSFPQRRDAFPTGTAISDRTQLAALSFREKADRVNQNTIQEISAQLLSLEQEHNRLLNAISLLDPRQQKILHLRYFDGLLWDEISTETDLSTRTLRSIKNQAINELAALYSLVFAQS